MTEPQTYTGTLAQRDFAGPVWVLETDETTYELRGELGDLRPGATVKVQATPAPAGFGFNMVGPILDVASVEVLEAQTEA